MPQTTTKHLTVAGLARLAGVQHDTIRQWRYRYEDFPEPASTDDLGHARYDQAQFILWFLERKPEKAAGWECQLHRFTVTSTGSTHVDTSPFGVYLEARGYLRAVRDHLYGEWVIWHTRDGFCAEKDGQVDIWAIDPTQGEPEEWFVYEQRYKAAGRKG
jgi:hypothetical protein